MNNELITNSKSSSKKKFDRILNLIFYLSIILFFIAFNFNDTPPFGWYQQFLPNLNGKSISDITFLDSLTGYAVATQSSDTSYILKTTNSGDNWSIIYRNFFVMQRIQFLNLNTGFACGAYLYKTTNGGFNWNQVNAPPISPENMYVLNEDTIWIISSESLTGGVFRTTNGGLSWTQQNSGLASKSGINVSIVISGFTSLTRLIVSAQIDAPPSGRSSRSTEVITQCLSFIVLIDSASLPASSGSGGRGLPELVAQNLHALVQISPSIIKVAVPLFQHSPIFGQLPLVQIV